MKEPSLLATAAANRSSHSESYRCDSARQLTPAGYGYRSDRLAAGRHYHSPRPPPPQLPQSPSPYHAVHMCSPGGGGGGRAVQCRAGPPPTVHCCGVGLPAAGGAAASRAREPPIIHSHLTLGAPCMVGRAFRPVGPIIRQLLGPAGADGGHSGSSNWR